MESTFKQYYELNISALIRFAQRFVPEEIAEDIVQDVFLSAWENNERHNGLPPRSFLYVAVKNKCLNYLKRQQINDAYIDTTLLDIKVLMLDYYDSSEKSIIDKEELQEVYRQIELLPDKCRQIFRMSYYEEKKNIEIAEELGISIRTVEHQLYLGLKTLRDKLTTGKKKNRFFMLFFSF